MAAFCSSILACSWPGRVGGSGRVARRPPQPARIAAAPAARTVAAEGPAPELALAAGTARAAAGPARGGGRDGGRQHSLVPPVRVWQLKNRVRKMPSRLARLTLFLAALSLVLSLALSTRRRRSRLPRGALLRRERPVQRLGARRGARADHAAAQGVRGKLPAEVSGAGARRRQARRSAARPRRHKGGGGARRALAAARAAVATRRARGGSRRRRASSRRATPRAAPRRPPPPPPSCRPRCTRASTSRWRRLREVQMHVPPPLRMRLGHRTQAGEPVHGHDTAAAAAQAPADARGRRRAETAAADGPRRRAGRVTP